MTEAIGAPLQSLKGRLFIFCLLLSSAALAAGVSPTASAANWDENREVTLKGARLEYFQGGEVLEGTGGVTLESGGIKVSAQSIVFDLKSNSLSARGSVVWSQEGNTIYAESVDLNLKTQLGGAHKLLFRRDSWAAWGSDSKKTGDKDIELSDCEATSCLRERPHYRLKASAIRVRLGERIWLDDVVVYVGLFPVFYVPSYTQSLRDPRPPFEIRPGYNKQTGAFVRGAYNYFLNDDNYGSIRLDWMDKQGTGYGLSHHYRIPGGQGSVAGYATRDKNDADHPAWTGNLSHSQELGRGLRLLANADMISQYRVNETYDTRQVDTFQNRSYLSLQSGQTDYSWSLGVGETQTLQPRFGADPVGGDKEYVVTARTLPSLSFSRYSRPLIRNTALYWGFSAQAGRSLIVPQSLIPQSGSGGLVSLYDLGRSYYTDSASLTPSLSHSLALLRGSALSTNLSFSESYLKDESGATPERGVSQASLVETLHAPLGQALNADLSWHYDRQLSQQESAPYAGLTGERASLNLNWQLSESMSLLGSSDYDLMPYKSDSDLKRLGLIRLQGLYSPNDHKNLSLVGAYDAQSGQVKSLDSNLLLNDPHKAWQAGLGTSWVNNRVILLPSSLDPLAPPAYAYEEPRRSPDQFLVNWRTSFAATEHWSLSLYQRLNVAARRVEEQAFSFTRDLHCWNLELYGRERSFTGWQFGFTLTLRALPQISASSNKITSDLFDDVSYGY